MSFSVQRPNHQQVIANADHLLKRLSRRDGTAIDVEAAAELLGARVIFSPLEGGISGFLFVKPPDRPIIGVNEQHSRTRQRFTIGHELGHLMLHAAKGASKSFVDKNFFVARRDQESEKGMIVEEVEANLFAAELLMPADTVYRDFVAASENGWSRKELSELAASYEVSAEAMGFRLSNLGFIRGPRL